MVALARWLIRRLIIVPPKIKAHELMQTHLLTMVVISPAGQQVQTEMLFWKITHLSRSNLILILKRTMLTKQSLFMQNGVQTHIA